MTGIRTFIRRGQHQSSIPSMTGQKNGMAFVGHGLTEAEDDVGDEYNASVRAEHVGSFSANTGYSY